jgi:hypothetical protein
VRQSLVGIHTPSLVPELLEFSLEPDSELSPAVPALLAAVVKLRLVVGTGVPSVPITPSTVTVYVVTGANGELGLTKARRPASAATTLVVAVPFGPLRVMLSEFMVDTCTGSENRIETTVSTGTFVAPLEGIVPDTSGGVAVTSALLVALPVGALKLCVFGSYTSSLSTLVPRASTPPAMSTEPSVCSVALWPLRGVASLPCAGSTVPSLGFNSWAVPSVFPFREMPPTIRIWPMGRAHRPYTRAVCALPRRMPQT